MHRLTPNLRLSPLDRLAQPVMVTLRLTYLWYLVCGSFVLGVVSVVGLAQLVAWL